MNSFGGCEEMMMSVNVVCPRPRRPAGIFHSPDFEAGDELLQLLLKKGEEPDEIDMCNKSPFSCGSPPRRVSNPVIHDVRFQEEMSFCPFMPMSSSSLNLVPSSVTARKTLNTMPTKFGFKPASMRIEGFDCLGRDGGGCSITAKA